MSTQDKSPHRDPARPEFWDERFNAGVMPWDAGRVPNALRAFAKSYTGARRILIPGCGSGWEVLFLAELGWDVVALDFSAAAITAARAHVGHHADRLLHADFFAFEPLEAFDVVYERTFLCALPRSKWPQYAARMSRLIEPGGLLVGFFLFSDQPKGPPFGTTPRDLEQLLTPSFEREIDLPVDDSIPLFANRERWQVWRRTAAPA